MTTALSTRVSRALENKLPHLFAGQLRDLLWILGALKSIDMGLCLDPRTLPMPSVRINSAAFSQNRGSIGNGLP